MPLPDIHTFKLKSQNKIKGLQRIELNFLNASFSETFTFKRRDILRILMLINTNEKEVFKFVQNIAK